MTRRRAARLLLAAAVAVGAAAPAFGQSTSPVSFGVAAEGITLTNFSSYFSLPVGLRVSGEYRLATMAPGLSVAAGADAGWWMESFRDTFVFHPELVPVMIPCAATVGLRWEPVPALVFEAQAQAGVVLELCPGARPTVLLYVSPGIDARWFFTDRVGVALRLGWAWAGADPIWGGPSIRLGPAFR
jgi:hypothetical protein